MKRMVVDSNVCTSCGYCEAVCSMSHSDGLVSLFKSRVRVRKNMKNGTAVTTVCRQCENPRCVQACPHFAMYQDTALGVPVIDLAKCAGVSCLACLEACPHGGLHYDKEAGLLFACDLCGGDPLCVQVCRSYPHLEHAALRYINRPD